MPDDLFGPEPVTRPCSICGKHYLGVIALCPVCEDDRKIYAAARKRGDKRQYIPYAQLLVEWKNRRAEVKAFRKAAETAQNDRAERERLEKEKSYLLLALNNVLHDANLLQAVVLAQRSAEDLTKERDHLLRRNEDLRNQVLELIKKNGELELKAMRDSINSFSRKSSIATTEIPKEVWRRLIQLVHPDKHGGSETANNATKWLLDNRP